LGGFITSTGRVNTSLREANSGRGKGRAINLGGKESATEKIDRQLKKKRGKNFFVAGEKGIGKQRG